MTSPLFTYADGSTLHNISAHTFVNSFPVWEANRTIDETHVSDLEASIKSPTEIQGLFSVISYRDEENKVQNRVIDGQHRQEVLRRYFNRNPAATDFGVLVRRYQIKNPTEAVPLFQQINNAKPMVYKGSATERLHEFVAALKKHFIGERGNGVVAYIRPACNRPCLATETLEQALKTYGIHERTDLTVEQLIRHAGDMNGFYAEDFSRIGGKFTRTMIDRATEYGFYLGLDPKCSWLLPLRP
jgi:hypothetical protein